jgi:hypothetical protein
VQHSRRNPLLVAPKPLPSHLLRPPRVSAVVGPPPDLACSGGRHQPGHAHLQIAPVLPASREPWPEGLRQSCAAPSISSASQETISFHDFKHHLQAVLVLPRSTQTNRPAGCPPNLRSRSCPPCSQVRRAGRPHLGRVVGLSLGTQPRRLQLPLEILGTPITCSARPR